MADVARLAGVSSQTVSRVSTGHPGVVDSTRRQVLAAMRELGYRPNSAARALKRGTFHTIGVILFTLSTIGNSRTVEAIAAQAAQEGYGITLFPVAAPTQDGVLGAFTRLGELAVDGIIVIMEVHLLDAVDLTLPPEVHPWAQELARAWIDEIKGRGYHVIGDLDDLVGPPPTQPYVDPDQPAESDVADAAVDAIRALLRENGRLIGVEEELHAQLEETRQALERSYLRPSYLARERVVRKLDSNRLGQWLLGLYRFGRGRSSRSA